MFKRPTDSNQPSPIQIERVTSVLGEGISWHGRISGKGGIRIEGIFEGEIALRGLVVVGETGKVTCENVRANSVIVAGAVHGNITADKLEIRSTGRVWGNVIISAFSTEEGAFLRGQVTMEDQVDLQFEEPESEPEASATENTPPSESKPDTEA
jgi:cytoskeletal protein CcmA (bactofilin family)